MICHTCGGKGYKDEKRCQDCNGTGEHIDQVHYAVEITDLEKEVEKLKIHIQILETKLMNHTHNHKGAAQIIGGFFK